MSETDSTPETVAKRSRSTYPFPADWHPVAAETGRVVLMTLVLAGVFALIGVSGEELGRTALGGTVVWRLAFGLAMPGSENVN